MTFDEGQSFDFDDMLVAPRPVQPDADDEDTDGDPEARPWMGRATVPPALYDKKYRKLWELGESEGDIGDYMVELNLFYASGLDEAAEDFLDFCALAGIPETRTPVRISNTYFRCRMSVHEWKELVSIDEGGSEGDKSHRVIYRVWPDFPIRPLIDRSVSTVKADAAVRAYEASGDDVVWAVIDSGIDKDHLHFQRYETLSHVSVRDLHRDFTVTDAMPDSTTAASALVDGYGHGTHVAGIIAGGIDRNDASANYVFYENVMSLDPSGKKKQSVGKRSVRKEALISGVAPRCRLVSLKVLDANGEGRSNNIMRALRYISDINHDPKLLRVHGVNISLGYEFDAEMFACGQSPLCVEVDRLVKSGVVVVVAAGNTGYGRLPTRTRQANVGISNTINDPGNARLAITVGATHRDSPHLYGVSYFSSKGPTGDGRLKPDLVAPGERITSCVPSAAAARYGFEANGAAAYIDDTGTSMAAPHVSGAIAAFLSIRREFIQRPEEVKKIFLDSATSLGRERYFEGNGLVDLMRAIQSV